MAAKRKAIEVTGEDGGPVDVTLNASLLDNDTIAALLAAREQGDSGGG